MVKRIVIIGAGTGGTLVANRLRRRYERSEAEIVVVDRDDRHVYQPGLLFVPFDLERPESIVRSRRAQLHDGIEFRLAEVERVEAGENVVLLADGERLEYDALVVASGASLLYEETEGLRGPGWGESVHAFYSVEDAIALRDALAGFEGGRLVVNLIDLPIKCPVAPLEFCLLADWFLRERGVREKTELIYATPLDAAFTKPVAAEQLGGMLESRGIGLEAEFATGRVDGAAGKLISWDEREIGFDLLVTVPLHGGARSSPARRASARSSASSTSTSTPCAARPPPTSSRSATPPACRPPRRAPRPTSRARRCAPTSSAASPAKSRRAATTATSTASSRAASTRRC